LRELATFGGDDKECYFTDGITIPQLSEKDTVQKVQGSIIVEIAELSGFNKKDDDEIKQWITTQEDDVRMPYAKTSQKFKRQFVLAATTNSYDYLKDPSGNRRYWCFRSKSVDVDGIIRQREQLWAEAVYLYKTGLYIGPTPEEIKLAETAQEKRRSIDVLEDRIVEKIGHLHSFRLDDLFSELGYAVKDMSQREQRRITNILRSLGYDNPVVNMGGKRERQWQKKAEFKAAGENYDIAF
jgi:predicted P-loop ATPase